MKKKYLQILLFILGLLIATNFVLALSNDLKILIKGKYEQKNGSDSQNSELLLTKVQNDQFEDIDNSYAKLVKEYEKAYKQKRKLIEQSSTIEQAFLHSTNMLNCCVEYEDKYSDLKEYAVLQLLVGDWDGILKVNIVSKKNDLILDIKRILEIELQSNQAGQISKGLVKGTETLVRKQIKATVKPDDSESIDDDSTDSVIVEESEKEIDKKIKEITGSITGNMIPQAASSFVISFDEKSMNSETPKKYSKLDISATTNVEMKPVVPRENIDEAYSLTVSNLKIYYSILLNQKMLDEEVLQYRFKMFFKDILYLLRLTSKGYISKGVYEPLGIYPESDYVSTSFEAYVITLCSYYSNVLSKQMSPEQKMLIYKKYMAELIQVSAITHLHLVKPDIIKSLNLEFANSNNTINQVFFHYYVFSKRYYEKQIKQTSDQLKKQYQIEYDIFKKDVKDFIETGIIHEDTLKELKLK